MNWKRCPICDEEIPHSSNFCSRCRYSFKGYAGNETGSMPVNDLDSKFYWLLRILAFMIDSIIVGIFVFAAFAFLFIPFLFSSLLSGQWLTFQNFLGYPFSMGLFQVAYFTVLEGWYHSSIGKRIMGLKIKKINGQPPSVLNSFLRNLSKIHIVFLFADVFFGAFVFNKYGRKITDRLAGTDVIHSIGYIRRFLRY